MKFSGISYSHLYFTLVICLVPMVILKTHLRSLWSQKYPSVPLEYRTYLAFLCKLFAVWLDTTMKNKGLLSFFFSKGSHSFVQCIHKAISGLEKVVSFWGLFPIFTCHNVDIKALSFFIGKTLDWRLWWDSIQFGSVFFFNCTRKYLFTYMDILEVSMLFFLPPLGHVPHGSWVPGSDFSEFHFNCQFLECALYFTNVYGVICLYNSLDQ